ncbi:putative peptidase C1-like protein L477 [Fusarium oxysporum f. sp. cubense]|uniref:Putative peptidase C1-like protein L477 n=1 Tax=Fusarium oxysporum f. sp. cubense TaxID=61366 RepID=A0A559LMA2_FUSOC|nr:putative peptidase C1-like protein L477 [Fusarium oxysporum f. sp. cubense]
MGGWYKRDDVSDGYDRTDRQYFYDGPAKDRNDLDSVNLLEQYPKMLDRYIQPTEITVADAVCIAVRFLTNFSNNGHLVSKPSRQFIYYNARALPLMDRSNNTMKWPNRVSHDPISIRQALRAVEIYGVAEESRYPWIQQDFGYAPGAVLSINERPSNIAYDEASWAAVLEPYRIDLYRPDVASSIDELERQAVGVTTLTRVKLCLSQGYPVIFAFHLFWDSFRTVGPVDGDKGYPTIEKVPKERRFAGQRHDKRHDSQAALIVGFDERKRRMLVQSMMESVPYFWMSYEWIMDVDATESFWMLKNSGRKRDRRAMEQIKDDSWHQWKAFGSWNLNHLADSSRISQAPNSSIATISRNRGVADMFWISDQCTLERAYYYPPRPWERQTIPLPENQKPYPGGIVCVSTDLREINVFWMTASGGICGAWGSPNETDDPVAWYPRTIAGSGTAEPRAGISADVGKRVEGRSHDINLYCVGPDGSIKHIRTMRDGDGDFTVTIVAEGGSAHPYSSISAVSGYASECHPDSIANIWVDAVFWIAPDGAIEGKRRRISRWVNVWTNRGKPGRASLASRIAAVGLTKNLIDIYFISPEDKLWVEHAKLSIDSDDSTAGDHSDEAPFDVNAAQGNSDIKAIWFEHQAQQSILVLWVSPDGKLMMGRQESREITELSVDRGVREGTPLGVGVCNWKRYPVIGMKVDDGSVAAGHWGSLEDRGW